MTQAIAKLRYLHVAPRKMRFVADLIRRLPVSEAEAQLILHPRRPAPHLLKLLRSAVANASQKKMDVKKLVIKEIRVDEGPKLKRYNPRARGSMAEIQKKMSHITMVLEESEKVKGREFIMPKKEKKMSKEGKKKRAKKGREQKKETQEKEAKPAAEKKGMRRFFRRKSI